MSVWFGVKFTPGNIQQLNRSYYSTTEIYKINFNILRLLSLSIKLNDVFRPRLRYTVIKQLV